MKASAEIRDERDLVVRKPALALRPSMGWNSRNSFRCYNINASTHIEMTDSLVDSGMFESGYDTFVADDCWQAHRRDGASAATRKILTNPNLIAVNQDALGAATQRAYDCEIDVWRKRFVDGHATLVVNRGESTAGIRLAAGGLHSAREDLGHR